MILEINPKPSVSVAVTVAAGINFIDDVNLYKQMIGYKKDWISLEEEENKKWMRRILIAKNNLSINHIEFYKVIGKVVKKGIMKNTPIKLDSLYDK